MNYCTDTSFIIALLMMLVSSELVTCQPSATKELSLLDDCKTTPYIICEYQLVLTGICLTRLSNNSQVAILYGACPYVTASKIDGRINFENYYHIVFNISTLTEQTCGPLNRKGLLCSECYEGYGPAVYAFGNECVKCHGSAYGRWALYLFVALFPITVFYVIVIVFNVNTVIPPFTAFVLYCQICVTIDRIQMPTRSKFTSKHHSPTILLLARTLSGIWNLDFGRHIIPLFCVSENLNTYHALLLDYILAFYPMLLILITYILINLHGQNFKPVVMLWQPFHKCFVRTRRTWDPHASIANTFATFLFLSSSKILLISFYSLQTEVVRYINYSTHDNRLYYSPSIQAHSHEHAQFIALSYTLATTFIFIPTIFLCCYPFKYFKKVVFCCCGRWQQTMDMFMDIFQGYYKDGSNGTYDWRFLAGTYPLLMVVVMSALEYNIGKHRREYPHMVYCLTVTAVYSLVRPYKKLSHNLVEILLLFATTATVSYATSSRSIERANYFKDRVEHAAIIALLFLLPHLVLAMVIIYKVLCIIKHRFESHYLRFKDKLPWVVTIWNKLHNAISGSKEQISDKSYVSYGTF